MGKRERYFMKNKKKPKKNPNKNNQNQAPVEDSCLEDYFDRVKKSRKCIKAKEYLQTYQNDKENWKFNVKIF
jgi:hypothetical protein